MTVCEIVLLSLSGFISGINVGYFICYYTKD